MNLKGLLSAAGRQLKPTPGNLFIEQLEAVLIISPTNEKFKPFLGDSSLDLGWAICQVSKNGTFLVFQTFAFF